MWGKHVIIDMAAGDREPVRSARHISRFVKTLVETIGMKAYGPPVLEHFAEHVPEAAGSSLVQLIETSASLGIFAIAPVTPISTFFPARISRLNWRLAGSHRLPPQTHQLSHLSARPFD
jgi:hypothetical protein